MENPAMKISHMFRAVCALMLSMSYVTSEAAVYTYGNLTSDDTTDYITDTVTGRLYGRFDALPLPSTGIALATQPGGAWEGWSIADSGVANDFINALLGGTSICVGVVPLGTECGTVTGWVDGAFGLSYDSVSEIFSYISTHDTPGRVQTDVGVAQILSSGKIVKADDWTSLATADNNASSPTDSLYRIGYLVYKDISPVPVPAAIWLFTSGLLGLLGVARTRIISETNRKMPANIA